MREAELLKALACQGEGIQITMTPEGTVVIDSGWYPVIRVVGNDLMKAAIQFAKLVLASKLPQDAPIRAALKQYDFYTCNMRL
jgi:hypothetical protein